MKIDSFANRLSKALTIRNMKPIDLAQKSGLNKATISQYLSGRYEAKQDNVYILSKALDINEAWLMGYDVPIKRIPDEERYEENLRIYITKDDSMAPLLDIDDIATILLKDTFQDGETILFQLDNIDYIRKVNEKGEYIEFKAMNPYFPLLVFTKKELKNKNFKIIGKVIKAENKSAFK